MACPCQFRPLVLGAVVLVIVYGLCFGGVEFMVRPGGARSCVTGQRPSLNHSARFEFLNGEIEFCDIYMYPLHLQTTRSPITITFPKIMQPPETAFKLY